MPPAAADSSGYPIVRHLLKGVMGPVLRASTRLDVRGREHLPKRGPLILASNHVGNLDPIVLGVVAPFFIEWLALAELLAVPGTRVVVRLYGVIPVYRDAGDGTALAAALQALAAGKVVGILPEGRMSVTGGLERARTGVAYLALASGVPVLPAALTGTERMLGDLRRGRRPRLTLTIGEPIRYAREQAIGPGSRERLRTVADEIMSRIAALLPPSYRGVYGSVAAPTRAAGL